MLLVSLNFMKLLKSPIELFVRSMFFCCLYQLDTDHLLSQADPVHGFKPGLKIYILPGISSKYHSNIYDITMFYHTSFIPCRLKMFSTLERIHFISQSHKCTKLYLQITFSGNVIIKFHIFYG